MKNVKQKEFWVTNLSSKDQSIPDLMVRIKARTSANLLSKNYRIPLEDLEKSKESGDLFKKRKFLKVRIESPQELVKPGIYVMKNYEQPRPVRTVVAVKFNEHEEFGIDKSEEKIIEELSDMFDDDKSDPNL